MGSPAGGEFSMVEHRTVAILYFIVGTYVFYFWLLMYFYVFMPMGVFCIVLLTNVFQL
mgnify:CR=1 FL=1